MQVPEPDLLKIYDIVSERKGKNDDSPKAVTKEQTPQIATFKIVVDARSKMKRSEFFDLVIDQSDMGVIDF